MLRIGRIFYVAAGIQNTVRDNVIIVTAAAFSQLSSCHGPACNGCASDGNLILQGDHLSTRANTATYANTRLIVCVCKGHHGWKNWHKNEYEGLRRQ
jgi:hypothetical protein